MRKKGQLSDNPLNTYIEEIEQGALRTQHASCPIGSSIVDIARMPCP
jgi:hypothetical protein